MPKLLQVWSFEERLTNKDKEDLLKHFGASFVQHVRKHGKDVAVVASFDREEDCEYAMKKLHQQDILGRRLMAVYKESPALLNTKQPYMKAIEEKTKEPVREDTVRKKLKEFEARLSAMAASLDIKHPIPPHLKYLYPPPSASIIANIVQMLVAVPKFYTQVLHLMNKMNLPAPFGTLKTLPSQYMEVLKLLGFSPKDQVNKDITDKDITEEEDKKIESDVSETESELESDADDVREKPKPSLPAKRKLRPSRVISKRPNLSLLKQTFVPHPRMLGSSVEEAFENIDSRQSKKLEVKLTGTLPTDTEANSNIDLEPGGFGMMEIPVETKDKTDNDPEEWKSEMAKYISKEELQSDRINKADWTILPVFKNYQQGEPSTKLYIKNLAKSTSEADLKHIYGRYIFWHNEEEASMFSVRLMKEGRMKGQAFVTFPSVEKATEALSDTNGYILNDKPMVVAFGKVKST